MLQIFGWYVSLSFGVLGTICWFGNLFFGIRARTLRKPGVSWFSPGMNFGSGLTEAGIRAMKWSWACVVSFLVCWLLSVVIGIITGAFDLAAR
jgi:hypothetical protein